MKRTVTLLGAITALGVAVAVFERPAAPGAPKATDQSIGLVGSASTLPFGQAPELKGRFAFEQAAGVSLTEYLDDLHKRVRAGDAEAAIFAYKREDECAYYAKNPPTPDTLPRFVARAKACEALSPRQIDERFADIRQAAVAGAKGAAFRFLTLGDPGQVGEIDPTSTDPALLQWRADALSFMERDASAGDPNAIAALTTVYSDGRITSKDPEKALLYVDALQALAGFGGGVYLSGSEGAPPPDGPASLRSIEADLISQIPSERLAEIKAQAQAFATRCCSKP